MSIDFEPKEWIRELFTSSDCWLLALNVHEKTGFPIVLCSLDEDVPEEDMAWVHVGVGLPDGRIMDIEGIFTIDEWMENWGGHFLESELETGVAVKRISPQGLMKNVESAGIVPVSEYMDVEEAADFIFAQ